MTLLALTAAWAITYCEHKRFRLEQMQCTAHRFCHNACCKIGLGIYIGAIFDKQHYSSDQQSKRLKVEQFVAMLKKLRATFKFDKI